MWRRIIGKVWAELTVSDSFPDDWYKWASNQGTHFTLGVAAACLGTVLWVHVAGEFPDKLWLFVSIAAIYAAFELAFQGWKGWDTVEDWIFVSVYGAGNAVLVFTEIQPGLLAATAHLDKAALGFGMFFGHLAAGIAWRLRRTDGNE